MGKEINLLEKYPKTKRDITKRNFTKKIEDQKIARKFDKDFFDGDRKNGYGGYHYNEKFWSPVVKAFKDYYNLKDDCKILDVGCAKGFTIFDFSKLLPNAFLRGIDVSEYAIKNSKEEVRDLLSVASCEEIPFEDNTFDLVISITTIHNCDYNGCIKSLREIERVSKKNSFITVDAFENDEEKKNMFAWNLTAKTILHKNEWIKLFQKAGYTGEYFWFNP